MSGFLLLRKRASCAICDCTRLRRRTPYHGADASLLRVNSPAPLLNESSSSANKTDKPFACPFCLMHYVRGIRTRALRKRHSASFLAAARRLLQSIKTADQGCFAKDKNESLFLRHKKPDKFCRVFCCFGRVILRNKIRGPRGILCTRGEKEHTSKRVSIIACNNVISKAKLMGTPKDTFVLLGRRSTQAKE